jgi:hypothetical protein
MSVLFLAAAQPSKTPFYILGGALVVWALVLAGIGLRRPEFPGDLRGQRGVIAVSLAMIVLAIGAAILTS